jgi:hypothetical protein
MEVVSAAENRRTRGRPIKLTPEIADTLVAQLTLGATLEDAAHIAGISSRTLRAWRARAWSKDASDAPFVELEKRVRDTRPARTVESWEDVAARVVANETIWRAFDVGL